MNPQLQQAIAHLNANEHEPAKAILRRVLQKNPRDAEANKLLGMLHAGIDENDHAALYLQRAAALAPNDPLLHFMHANVLLILKKDKDALAAYRNVSRLAPSHFDGYDGQAKVLLRMGRHDEAVAAYESGIAATPDDPASYRTYALALSTMGRVDDAIAVLRRGIARLPQDPGLRESLCYQLNFTEATTQELFEQHRQLGELVSRATIMPHDRAPVFANSRDPDRPLRVGFLSGDFCNHACALFMQGLIANLDRARVQPYCYYLRATEEAATQTFKQLAPFRPAAHLSDDDLRAQIRADQVDILIDTAGWTEHQRLSLFTPRAAPLQMTWLGYPNTTGIPAVDYRIVDAITDPPGAEAFATEKLLRVPGCFLSFTPTSTAPEPKLSPFLVSTSQIPNPKSEISSSPLPLTFGSFNRLSKVRPAITRTWARILARVPNSRLFLKSNLISADVKAQYNAIFQEEGIVPDRILWSSYIPTTESHLAAYHQVDLALDSFPYHGTTTTCEATWMGVPVITLAGDHHRSRVGASLLTALGLQSHIAHTHEQYIELAVNLATDLPRLLDLHITLRARMAASPLCDTRTYAANFEAALRQTWRTWCSQA